MTAPNVTAELFEESPDSIAHEFACLLEEFSAAEIFNQLFQLDKKNVLPPAPIPEKFAKQFIKRSTLEKLLFERLHEEAGMIEKIVLLNKLFPGKEDHIASLLLHLDIFIALLKSSMPSDQIVEALLDIFPKHKNGFAIMMANPEIFAEVKKDPLLAQRVIDSLSDLLQPSLVEQIHSELEKGTEPSSPDAPSHYSP